jgi:hypothetical protein
MEAEGRPAMAGEKGLLHQTPAMATFITTTSEMSRP